MPALLDAEVTSKVGLVSEQELETFFDAKKAKVKPGDEAQARDQMRAYLQNQKLAQQREAFLQSLRAQAKIVINLKPPTVQRVTVNVEGAPFKGPAKAAVTLVEFTDFHCPFCKKAQPTLEQLQRRYGDKVKFVHKDFPIDSLHPQARAAHEAARCANEQGKFWVYRERIFAAAPKSGPEDLQTYAKQMGLDVPAFEKCVAAGKYKLAVESEVEEGRRAGVSGTPAFFILVVGAQPLEAFVRLVDDELSRTE